MPSLQPTQQQSGLTATLSRGFARVLATVPHPPRSARVAWRVRRRGLRRLFRRSPAMIVEAAPRAECGTGLTQSSKTVRIISGEHAFRPLTESGCPPVKT